MARLFGDSVPREFYDRVLRELDRAHDRALRADAAADKAQAALAKLAEQYADLKRQEVGGLRTEDYDRALKATDLADGLGPKTRHAIDMEAGGDPQLARHLLVQAKLHMATIDGDQDEIDAMLSRLIVEGDA